jgi:predicted N-formylglutamate amidohydrolase
MARRMSGIVVSCEHASGQVPARWRGLFRGQSTLLASHRSWDIGAISYARPLACALDAPLFQGRHSRLLADLNRSLHHPRLFSDFTRQLPPAERSRILAWHYHPYRSAVCDAVLQRMARDGRVLHLSAHTFTPVLEGKLRGNDLALLYDPRRSRERILCRRLGKALRALGFSVRMNWPYRGVADGFTTCLRHHLPASRYAGIEIEVNQRLVCAPHWRQRRDLLVQAFAGVLAGGA